jgi:UDP-N-acetylglucosamine--N-acetylmuramyl-(pentapeptide) pyrophosphoryl-undecaprenol N-acetylglucosamine transferase
LSLPDSERSQAMSTPKEWSLVVCGGGSGGHLFPALATIQELRRRQLAPRRIVFLTADRAIDSTVLQDWDVEQIALPSIDSTGILRRPIRSARQIWEATRQAKQILKTLPAPVVMGTGGFSSVPGVLAARWRRRPILLLEQNVIPGRATALLVRFAHAVCLSFLETTRFLPTSKRIHVTGNPVRQEIAYLKTSSVARKKRLLILGGSQGATAINQAMVRFAQQHHTELAGWTILHQTGRNEDDSIRQAYRELNLTAEVAPFFPNMLDLYERASLVVTRAGGTSLAEISCAGLPAVIIPYPRSLRNHQTINARHYVGRNAAVMVHQGASNQFDADLAAALVPLLSSPEQRKSLGVAMKMTSSPDAASAVCDHLLKLSPVRRRPNEPPTS